MTIFVELPPSSYDKAAFANFNPSKSDLDIGNARAMMWTSQLAYETGHPQTIDIVSPQWGFSSATPFGVKRVDVTASFDTSGLLAERPDAILLAFAGTDPGVWETLATDGNFRIDPQTDTRVGFQAALNAVQAQIAQAVALSRNGSKPLWITGHSLGAALAALAAEAAASLQNGVAPMAVYVFGMPRAGGATFQARYNNNAKLGPITYRFVHGLDVVASIPPSGIGYRHVGRMLACASGQEFDAASPLSALGTDDPQFSQQSADTVRSTLARVLTGNFLSPAGPGILGFLYRFLPQPIRDHLQDGYYNALA